MFGDDTICPLCCEELSIQDKSFLPCQCGYQVCMWCWHHIKNDLNGLCPACRTPYSDDPHAFAKVDRDEVIKQSRQKKEKEKKEKKQSSAGSGNASGVVSEAESKRRAAASNASSSAGAQPSIAERKNLQNIRVVQRNLVYVIGIPPSIASEEMLRRAEYFGQFGRIVKVVVNRNHSGGDSAGDARGASASAYITFAHKEDAKACIQSIDGFWLEGRNIRASFGTTKYCNAFLRGLACNNSDCLYLHELGQEEDSFTKEQIQSGQNSFKNSIEVHTSGGPMVKVTGSGGPSGTGRRASHPVLPPPVFEASGRGPGQNPHARSNGVASASAGGGVVGGGGNPHTRGNSGVAIGAGGGGALSGGPSGPGALLGISPQLGAQFLRSGRSGSASGGSVGGAVGTDRTSNGGIQLPKAPSQVQRGASAPVPRAAPSKAPAAATPPPAPPGKPRAPGIQSGPGYNSPWGAPPSSDLSSIPGTPLMPFSGAAPSVSSQASGGAGTDPSAGGDGASRGGSTLGGPVPRHNSAVGPSFDKLSKIWGETGANPQSTPGGGSGGAAATWSGSGAGGASVNTFNSAFASALFPVTPFHGFRSTSSTAGEAGVSTSTEAGGLQFDAVAALLANSLPPIDQAVSLSFPGPGSSHATSSAPTMHHAGSTDSFAHTSPAQHVAEVPPYPTTQPRPEDTARGATAPSQGASRPNSGWASAVERGAGAAATGGNIWGTGAVPGGRAGSSIVVPALPSTSVAWPGLDAHQSSTSQTPQTGKSLQSDMAMLQQMLPGVNLTYGEEKQQMQGAAPQQSLRGGSRPIRVARP